MKKKLKLNESDAIILFLFNYRKRWYFEVKLIEEEKDGNSNL